MARDEAGEGLRGRLWVSGLLSPGSVSDHRTLGVTKLGDPRGRKINNTNPQTGRDSHCSCGKNH